MSKKHSSHLRGERDQAFAELIRGVPAEQILCVSIDISKYFHLAMIHNGLGEIVMQPVVCKNIIQALLVFKRYKIKPISPNAGYHFDILWNTLHSSWRRGSDGLVFPGTRMHYINHDSEDRLVFRTGKKTWKS
jgi:hypothetical protein